MTLAALLDLCPGNFDFLVSQLKTLGLGGWEIQTERRGKNGIDANYAKVLLSHGHDGHGHAHRSHADIAHMIEKSGISDRAKELSINIFGRMADAEAKIHGVQAEDVRFHEVGAADSIIDIVGAAVLADLLSGQFGIEKICCSPVGDGHGFANCQHGKIPVPAPATVEIFKNSGIRMRQLEVPHELATPTGAAIVAELAQGCGPMPEMAVAKAGYGAGTRDLEIPNVLRVVLGDADGKESERTESITVIEANIDDCPPEILAYAMERLFEEGANDVFFTPIYMKKNRPATKLTALCKNESAERLAKIIFSETTTIGLRIREEKRICLARGDAVLQTEFGELKAKKIEFEGEEKLSPEYEHAKKLARDAGVPLRKIYESARPLT